MMLTDWKGRGKNLASELHWTGQTQLKQTHVSLSLTKQWLHSRFVQPNWRVWQVVTPDEGQPVPPLRPLHGHTVMTFTDIRRAQKIVAWKATFCDCLFFFYPCRWLLDLCKTGIVLFVWIVTVMRLLDLGTVVRHTTASQTNCCLTQYGTRIID